MKINYINNRDKFLDSDKYYTEKNWKRESPSLSFVAFHDTLTIDKVRVYSSDEYYKDYTSFIKIPVHPGKKVEIIYDSPKNWSCIDVKSIRKLGYGAVYSFVVPYPATEEAKLVYYDGCFMLSASTGWIEYVDLHRIKRLRSEISA